MATKKKIVHGVLNNVSVKLLTHFFHYFFLVVKLILVMFFGP